MRSFAALLLLAFLCAFAPAFAADQLSYGADYRGRDLELEGYFSHYFINEKDKLFYIHMRIYMPEGETHVICCFSSTDGVNLLSLKEHAKISLKGRCTSSSVWPDHCELFLNKCSSVSILEPPAKEGPWSKPKANPKFLAGNYAGKTVQLFGEVAKGELSGDGASVVVSKKLDGGKAVVRIDLKESLGKFDLNTLKIGADAYICGVCVEQKLEQDLLNPKESVLTIKMVDAHIAISPLKSGPVAAAAVIPPAKQQPAPAKNPEPEGKADAERKLADAAKKAEADKKEAREKEEAFAVSFNEAEAMKSIITVKGDKSSGTGFIASWKGRKHLITNIHVILDNESQFLTVSNERVEASDPMLCEDRDLAFFLLDEKCELPALELEEDMGAVEAESPVVVYGNSLGAEVNTRLKGKMKSLGPKNLEISAEIVPGNSGSPILSAKTGKVLGVAAYGIETRPTFVDGVAKPAEVHRFGLRLDNVDPGALQKFDAKKYESDVKMRNALAAANELAFTILSDIFEMSNGSSYPTLDPSKYDLKKYPSMGSVIKDWNDLVRKDKSKAGAKSIGSVNNPASALKRLKSQVSTPVAGIKGKPVHYKWIKGEIDRELECNESYCAAFEKMIKNNNSVPGL